MESFFKEALNDWDDWDTAAFHLAQALGIFNTELDRFAEVKYLFWTDNEIGHTLHIMLNQLVDCGILEARKEPDLQFRWN